MEEGYKNLWSSYATELELYPFSKGLGQLPFKSATHAKDRRSVALKALSKWVLRRSGHP